MARPNVLALLFHRVLHKTAELHKTMPCVPAISVALNAETFSNMALQQRPMAQTSHHVSQKNSICIKPMCEHHIDVIKEQ
jgi:hypothetical protein